MPEKAEPKFTPQAEALLDWQKAFDRTDSKDNYFPSGFKVHDRALGRMRRGQLIVVAALSSIGKTAFMLSMALHQLALGIRVYWFSLELPKVDMMSRIISIKTGVPLLDIVERRIGEDGVRRIVGELPAISALPAAWTEDPNLPHMMKLLNQIQKGSRSIVYVDHLHLIDVPGVNVESRYALVTEALLTLKRAAMALSLPVVVACQLNQRAELRKDKTLIFSDLKNSSDIGQGAQLVLGLQRPGFYNRDISDNELDVCCLKNTNGPRVNYLLEWDGPCAAAREKSGNGGWGENQERRDWL